MKKSLCAIVSALAGIFTFILLALNWLEVKTTVREFGSSKETFNGWELIKDKVEIDGYIMYKIFAIVILVVAILLILLSAVMLLKSSRILKIGCKLSFINNILLIVLVVSVILAIVGLFIMANEMSSEALGIKTSAYPTVGAWIQLSLSVVACGLGLALSRKG